MPAMHAVQKMLAQHARPVRATVNAGEFLEIEPDVFSVIISFNPTEAEHLARDLEELGVTCKRRSPRDRSRTLAGAQSDQWQRDRGAALREFFRDMMAAGGEKAYLKARIARERAAAHE